MSARKFYGFSLAIAYIVLAESLQRLAFSASMLLGMVTNGFRVEGLDNILFSWGVIIFCEIIPAIAVAWFTIVKMDGIFQPLLLTFALLFASIVLYYVLAFMIGLFFGFNFGALVAVLLILGLIGAPTCKAIVFIIEE